MSDDVKLVASIEFYYDPLTEVPKFRVRNHDRTELDPLAVYAMMGLEVLQEHHQDVYEKASEFITANEKTMRIN